MLVSAAQSRELQAKGFTAVLRDYPPDISSFGGGLVLSNGFLLNDRDVVSKVVHGPLTQATRTVRCTLKSKHSRFREAPFDDSDDVP